MNRTLFYCFAGLCALLLMPTARAHHSFASEFDQQRPVLIEGVVKRMSFANPHSYIYMEVTTDSGEVEEWAIGGTSPNALLRRGWSKKSLPAGTKIKVRGFQARDRSNRAYGADITLPDGSKLFMGTTGIGGPQEDNAEEADPEASGE